MSRRIHTTCCPVAAPLKRLDAVLAVGLRGRPMLIGAADPTMIRRERASVPVPFYEFESINVYVMHGAVDANGNPYPEDRIIRNVPTIFHRNPPPSDLSLFYLQPYTRSYQSSPVIPFEQFYWPGGDDPVMARHPKPKPESTILFHIDQEYGRATPPPWRYFSIYISNDKDAPTLFQLDANMYREYSNLQNAIGGEKRAWMSKDNRSPLKKVLVNVAPTWSEGKDCNFWLWIPSATQGILAVVAELRPPPLDSDSDSDDYGEAPEVYVYDTR